VKILHDFGPFENAPIFQDLIEGILQKLGLILRHMQSLPDFLPQLRNIPHFGRCPLLDGAMQQEVIVHFGDLHGVVLAFLQRFLLDLFEGAVEMACVGLVPFAAAVVAENLPAGAHHVVAAEGTLDCVLARRAQFRVYFYPDFV
jgi:hypothetical protein